MLKPALGQLDVIGGEGGERLESASSLLPLASFLSKSIFGVLRRGC